MSAGLSSSVSTGSTFAFVVFALVLVSCFALALVSCFALACGCEDVACAVVVAAAMAVEIPASWSSCQMGLAWDGDGGLMDWEGSG